jgi:hypothetical protein
MASSYILDVENRCINRFYELEELESLEPP